MFRPRIGQQLLFALALGLILLPAVSHASVLSQLNWTTTQAGIPANGLDFNLTNNALLINTGTGVDPNAVESQLQTMVATAFDNFAWDGHPATSSAPSTIGSYLPAANAGSTYTQYPNAAIDPNGTTALGIMTGTDYINNFAGAGTPTFYGVTVTPSMVLLKYTFYGDTDLSGAIEPGDIANTLFGQAAHLTGWANGKTDYTTNPVGAGDIANVLFSQAAQTQAIYAHPLAESGALGGGLSVPEPSSIVLAGMAAIGAILGALRLRKRSG